MLSPAPPRLVLPNAPILAVHPKGAHWLDPDGEWEDIALSEAARRVRQIAPILCHRNAVAARLGMPPFAAFDALELFAFARPATFAVPTIAGLAEVLELPPPAAHGDEPETLLLAAQTLLSRLSYAATLWSETMLADRRGIAWFMSKAGWAWGPAVQAALGSGDGRGSAALRVWERLSEWDETAPTLPPGNIPVDPAEARARLAEMLGKDAEQRPTQSDYASAAALAFLPRQERGAPNVVLAEAGTGTGKTLGYIAPASLWAEKNQAPVWISTFTRNLQRQLDHELSRLHPSPAQKAAKVVIRKGRENYLCLLNLDEATSRLTGTREGALPGIVALGLVAMWALSTRDGDMIGGDLPGWLADLLGAGRINALADRRGECIYSACPHFRKCFIEKTVRRARGADIVVANHALVMMQAALGGLDDGYLPARYVFDEGHHLFDAADNAFAAELSGLEAAELRRWLLGAEADGKPSRARGLKRRIEDLIASDEQAKGALDEALRAARVLPGPGWHQRMAAREPLGACESFLHLVRAQVLARATGVDGPYGLECDPRPPNPGVGEAAAKLQAALARLAEPLDALSKALAKTLGDEAARLETPERQRIEAVTRSIARRATAPLTAWISMLAELPKPLPDPFADWFSLSRADGKDLDVGFHRHWIDPTLPFAEAVARPAHGIVVTSATLRDGSGDLAADWRAAEQRIGTMHLPLPAIRAAVASPFDYAKRTRVFIVTDVRKDDLAQVGAAYRELFLAAKGGALGLFTAISRLRAVHRHIAPALDEAGIELLAQHLDGMDTSTVVDIFRAEENACLLGTDAVRDGVDVPGRSLRLIVFDRVPWPRPDLLHKARRARFGGKSYDDMITRLRLKQAFGRLVRRADDSGVFVLLDPMMPSRLFGAFPEGVAPQRVGLAEAVREVGLFLAQPTEPLQI